MNAKEALDYGRKIRLSKLRSLREAIPPLKDITFENYISVESWFEKYKLLAESGFRKLKIKYFDNYIEVSYVNYTKYGFKNFTINLPRRFILNDEFVYFFGLWCGDRAGGGRFGIINQEKAIIDFTKDFLIKYNQNIESILYITKGLPDPKTGYDKRFIIDKEINGWAISVHSTNGILSSFFHYLQANLMYFLSMIPNKYSFFAGLFDAEGNVSLMTSGFKWACKNESLVKIYSIFLKELGLYRRYDGGCLITYNKLEFYNKILPYLKHTKKINNVLFVCIGKGNLPDFYSRLLGYVKTNPNKTAKAIAKGLKEGSVYAELRLLKDHGFISSISYPYKFIVTAKGSRRIIK